MWWPPVSGKAVLYSEADRMPAAPVQKPGRKPGPASVIKRNVFLHYVLQHRCGRVQALVHEHTTLGFRPAPGTPSGTRSVGTRRAASMQDTLSERTARAAQLAASAVTASAVGGSATRSVSRSTRDRAAWRSRSSSERLGNHTLLRNLASCATTPPRARPCRRGPRADLVGREHAAAA